MRLGFVYDLKADYAGLGLSEEALAEFDGEETIAAIAAALQSFGFEVDRIGHVKALVARLAQGDRWDLVFNCAEGQFGPGREATVPALLDAYQIPYTFSGPVTMTTTLDKAVAKKLVAAAGVPTARYAVVNHPADVEAVTLPFPLFAKPLAEGSGKGVLARSHVRNKIELREICERLLADFAQPVLVETYLPGREFTVGILGGGAAARIIGVAEIGMQHGADGQFNSYHNKQNELETYHLVRDAEALRAGDVALKAWIALDGQDAGRIDLRSDAAGQPHFLEANPLAGLKEGYSELPILAEMAGLSHHDLLRAILQSALSRHGLSWPVAQDVA